MFENHTIFRYFDNFKNFVEYAISFNFFYICTYENIFKMIVNNNRCRIRLIEIYENERKK